MKYTVKPGESFYSIANKYGITLFSLIISNPQVSDPSRIYAGQVINVPISPGKIVDTTKPYTYEEMVLDINQLQANYPFLKVDTIGRSVLGKPIYAISFGEGENQLTYNASHHANEWITSLVQMQFIEEFAKHIVSGEPLYGFDVRDIYERSTIRVVPMVNPDGVNLVIKGLTPENEEYHERLIEWNNGSTNFDDWNANIRGVDINHNYDAGWQIYKDEIEPKLGITGPAPKRYSGPYPVSEPETKAMVELTNSDDYRQVIAYHSQGEVIYWDYMNKAPKESLPMARKYGGISGYRIAGIAPGPASLGGYKDWFIDKFNKPGFTVEVGKGKNPLPLSQFQDIYNKSVGILLLAPYL